MVGLISEQQIETVAHFRERDCGSLRPDAKVRGQITRRNSHRHTDPLVGVGCEHVADPRASRSPRSPDDLQVCVVE